MIMTTDRPKKIIFHCGSAKTGSTTIQNFLWAHREILAAKAIHYCPRFVRQNNVDSLNLALRAMRRASTKDQAIKAGRARLKSLFEDQGFHTVIVSNESALGDPFVDSLPGFFPLLEAALEAAQKMFAPYAVVPVFFVRDQATLLPSFYGQRIRQGAAYSLGDYAARALPCDLSWGPVFEKLGESFGQQALEIHKFEDLVQSPADYTTNLFSQLLELESFDARLMRKRNRGAKSHALALMRGVNLAVDALPGLAADSKRAVKKKLRRGLFPLFEKLKTGQRVCLPAPAQQRLRALYQADLLRLNK
jgi:hypothetical protein